jgi:porin
MRVCWRAATAAASLCFAGSAAAQKHEEKVEAAAGAASVNPPNDQAAPDAEQVYDRIAPPAVDRAAPAFDPSVVYTADVLRKARGGDGRGTRYLDNLDVTLTVNAERAFGWPGAALFAYGLYDNGEPLSDDLVGAAQGVSNIETGVRAARLYEASIEQRSASDRASVRDESPHSAAQRDLRPTPLRVRLALV